MASKQADDKPKMKRKDYEKELRKLQVELCHLQDWVKAQGSADHRLSRDATPPARAAPSRPSPSGSARASFAWSRFRRPRIGKSRRCIMQRYIEQFPAAGEIVIFDRSWYNRAGVEHVMGFCDEEQYQRFLELVPGNRKIHRRWRHHTDQDLAGSRQGGAGPPIRGPHRRSAAPMETQPDGSRSLTVAGTTIRGRATGC